MICHKCNENMNSGTLSTGRGGLRWNYETDGWWKKIFGGVHISNINNNPKSFYLEKSPGNIGWYCRNCKILVFENIFLES